MTSVTAIDLLGGEDEVARFAKEASRKWGVSVSICAHVDEDAEKETDADGDWLDVLVETPHGLFDNSGRSAELGNALEAIEAFLGRAGLFMEYECGGDGETGPTRSYRVI